MVTLGILQIAFDPNAIEVLDRFERRHPIVCSPHVTLVYGAIEDSYKELVGTQCDVRLMRLYQSNRVDALEVRLPPDIRMYCQNRHPHITLSHQPDASAVESNSLLVLGQMRLPSLDLRLIVGGTIEFVAWEPKEPIFCGWTMNDIKWALEAHEKEVSDTDAIAIKERCKELFNSEVGLCYDLIWDHALDLAEEGVITLLPFD